MLEPYGNICVSDPENLQKEDLKWPLVCKRLHVSGFPERLVSGLESLFLAVDGEANCITHAQDSEPAL